MPHPPIILFDFDGVVLTQKALEFTALFYKRKKFYNWKNTQGLRLIDFARLFEESDSDNRFKALIQAYRAYKPYIPNPLKRIIFFIKFRRTYPKYEKYETLKPNLKKVLKFFKSINSPLGIVSNTKDSRLEYFRKQLELDEYFSAYISRDDSLFRKPHPYPIFNILTKIEQKCHYSVDKKLVYFIGDLPTDILCAHNAGVNSIALLNGHGTENELKRVNPTYILNDISDITEIEPFKKLLLD
ncbi:MAG: HAD family hydrolase [Promethearchaeota archaeon]|nr:MAG: HAD family hydrolase [Candidatus Lokiarchaeota archaeon]